MTRKKLISILLVFVMLFAFTPIAFADGDGTGSGGGKDEPLALVSSSPVNNQKNVATDLEITLEFSKNVVNMTVNENNMKCFTLKTKAGKLVATKVIMADDQVNPEGKNTIKIVPVSKLKAGTTYVLTISSKLKSKSGATLGKDKKITFTVKK